MTTFGDQLKQFGGVPVASNEFAGWWGNDVWFVDYDNGIRANDEGMNDMKHPQKDLYRAIADASAGDVIYMRPRKALTGANWFTNFYISPASTEEVNWTIPATKDHLSIIGTIKPGPSGGLLQKAFLTGYAGQTTPTITVLAPYFCMENMGIGNASGQANGLIKVDNYTAKGYGATVNNCSFRNYKPDYGSEYAAVYFETSSYSLVVNSTFHKCLIGVMLGSVGGAPGNNAVVNCDFYGINTELTCDIIMGDVTYMLIDSNRFHHGKPSHAAGGAPISKYVYVSGTSATGILSNNYFGTTDTTIGTACTLQSIQGIGNKCENSTVWMTTT